MSNKHVSTLVKSSFLCKLSKHERSLNVLRLESSGLAGAGEGVPPLRAYRVVPLVCRSRSALLMMWNSSRKKLEEKWSWRQWPNQPLIKNYIWMKALYLFTIVSTHVDIVVGVGRFNSGFLTAKVVRKLLTIFKTYNVFVIGLIVVSLPWQTYR